MGCMCCVVLCGVICAVCIAQASKGSIPVSNVLSTTNRIVAFGAPAPSSRAQRAAKLLLADPNAPPPSASAVAAAADGKKEVIVYIDGAFDLFHVGHIEALAEARKMGTYLIVRGTVTPPPLPFFFFFCFFFVFFVFCFCLFVCGFMFCHRLHTQPN
jgi:hypothetical protein